MSLERFLEQELGIEHEWSNLPCVAREYMEGEWMKLTRETMPTLAKDRGWPVHLDHCFQRILLDNACRGDWRKEIKSPAYRNADTKVLHKAIEMAKAVIDDQKCLHVLNRRSLQWRRKT